MSVAASTAIAIGLGAGTAATGIVGAKMQSDATSDAAGINAKGTQAALDFEKAQYADLTKRLDPYVQAGGASSDRMARLMGLPQRPGTTAGAPPVSRPFAGPMVAQPAPAASGALVTLRAPDGSTKQVSARDAPHYISRGAVRMTA